MQQQLNDLQKQVAAQTPTSSGGGGGGLGGVSKKTLPLVGGAIAVLALLSKSGGA